MDDVWVDPEPVHSAAQDGDVGRLSELVAEGHAVNAFDDLGHTPLHYAVEKGHLDAARFLIGSRADVNAHDERVIGETPLGEVAGTCSLQMARLLVEAGADPTIPGWMQLTALDKAKGRKRGDGPQVYEYLNAAAKRRRGSRGS
jgi:ankyrin repeat protein